MDRFGHRNADRVYNRRPDPIGHRGSDSLWNYDPEWHTCCDTQSNSDGQPDADTQSNEFLYSVKHRLSDRQSHGDQVYNAK